MILSAACSYLPDADEVVIDFRSTLDDGVTPTIADSATFVLSSMTEDQLGTESFNKLAQIVLDSSYVMSNQNYLPRFRHPERKMHLWVDVTAIYAGVPYQAHVEVGESTSPQIIMNLPENKIWEYDEFEVPLTGGPTELPNANQRVLSEEIQDYIETFDFTTHSAIEDFSPPLTYQGGGNRLLLNNQNNQYVLQTVNAPYWDVLDSENNETAQSTFAFAEPAGVNLLPNPFFLNIPLVVPANGPTPVGWEVDASTTVCLQTVDFDYTTSSYAKLWTLQFNQVNGFSAFNEVTMNLQAPISILSPGNTYTFSTYAKIALLNEGVITGLTLGLSWYNGPVLLTESVQEIPASQLTSLTLVSLAVQAPPNATSVVPSISMGSVEAGDNVLLSLFGAQLEFGSIATTRMNGVRVQDQLTVPDYNAVNQKIRFQVIPGFSSTYGVTLPFIQGPLVVSFMASGDLLAEIPGQGSVITPLTFAAGDTVDITVEHQSGKFISVYQAGQLLAQTPLPTFTSTLAPLNILGVGVEILSLSVWTRE